MRERAGGKSARGRAVYEIERHTQWSRDVESPRIYHAEIQQLRNGCDPGGQEDGKDGARAFSRSSAQAQPSTMSLHDIVTDPETKPGAGVTLGGDERLEDATPDCFRNSAARVGDHDAHTMLRVVAPAQCRTHFD